jgi:hypothetical protein
VPEASVAVPRPVRRFASAMTGPLRWSLLALAAGVFAAVAGTAPSALPWVCVVLYLVVGGLFVRPLHLLLDLLGVGAVVLVVLTLAGRSAWTQQTLGLVLIGAAVLGLALRRDRDEMITSIGGAAAADAMLLDLRERMGRRRPPELPPAWNVQSDLRAARGDGFCGDFVVTAGDGRRRLDVALVDVSGQGAAAGARALLLSGAVEALLHAVPEPDFLAAANEHVLRLGDDEGFATAVQVGVDLDTGDFTVRGAGHPPAVHYRAGAGRWMVLEADQGPALGLIPGARYPSLCGHLSRGDLLMLYTDGLVESRDLDVGRGIDRLVGHAETILARTPADQLSPPGVGARSTHPALAVAIAGAIRAEDGDDRALVVIHRR